MKMNFIFLFKEEIKISLKVKVKVKVKVSDSAWRGNSLSFNVTNLSKALNKGPRLT